MLIRHIFFLLKLTVLSFHATAQNGGYSLFRSFTVADGLPSNHIYTCVEDNKGFIWVATQGGLARFDGRRFQVFTTKNGLPDDEVLDVVKEKNGRIWANCFTQSPAYFDEVKNRFINAKEDTLLAKLSGTGVMDLTALPGGGVMYSNSTGSYFYVDGKFSHFNYVDRDFGGGRVIQKNNDDGIIAYGNGKEGVNAIFFYYKNGRIRDSLRLERVPEKGANVVTQDHAFYTLGSKAGVYYIYSDFKTDPLRCKLDSVSIGEPIFWRRFTPDNFIVISTRGNLHVFDRKTLRHRFVLNGNYSPNSLYNDSRENIWIGTIDKGLFLYKKKDIETFAIPGDFTNTNFMSIARKPGGAIFAGNFYGEIVETDGRYFIVHTLPGNDASNWQRKIISINNNVYTFTEKGVFVNFEKPLLNANGAAQRSKTAAILNDSILIRGFFGGLSQINTISGKSDNLPSFTKRTTAVGIAPGNMIYHGSTDGLYKFDYNKKRDDSLLKNHPLLGDRITAITASPEGYVWIATASKGVLVLQNDRVVKIFTTKDGLVSNSINCLAHVRPGEVWVGTNSGISIIRYKVPLSGFTYQNLTINDGLSNNIINEMLYSSDTVYCATGNGISAVPVNIRVPRFDIPVSLTGISINNIDTSLHDRYELKHNQNNIELHFAGIEPSGHFNYFQYRVNNGDWLNLEGNALTLQLNSGSYQLAVRAIDVNGNAGTKPLLIAFTLSTPFWKAIWFWLLIMGVAGGILVWILRKREMAKRELALQEMMNQKKLTELELQALKSQINPHFIFNCLNSIKLLSHQQKHQEAEKYLDKFAALLRAAMEQSSIQQITLKQEIGFIDNYLSLEKLRFPGKLSYQVEVDPNLHPGAVLIPSMLLQPYVENAVKHGVAPLKDRPGHVLLRFFKKNGDLVAEVHDNGNGIQVQQTSGRTGIGMANTRRRSKLHNIVTEVIDLATTTGTPGTLIRMIIPLQKANT